MIREISRKFPDTRKIELVNDTKCTMHVKCVVTADGNIHMELYDKHRTGTRMIPSYYHEVIPIKEVDF